MKSAAMSQIRIMFLFILALVPVLASAVTVDGLYRVQVPVADTSSNAQQAAYSDGLRQVLLRVSGSREVLQSDQIGPLLANAESLVQSYQYQTSPDGTDQLMLAFGSVGVNRALAKMQVPVWGANRPLTLGWIAVDSGRDRWILTSDDTGLNERGRWTRAFSEAAVHRGLPFVLPPSDVRSSRDLVSEIRGQFMDNLRSKASAYPHNLISVVNVTRRGSGWEASWRLDGPAFSETGEVRDAASSESLARAVVDAWADLLAERYSVDAGEVSDAQRVDLVIDNVNSVEAYGAVMSSLDNMTPVLSAGPVKADPEKATMRVAFSGELSVLKEYIALDARFEPVEAEGGAVDIAPGNATSNQDESASAATSQAAKADQSSASSTDSSVSSAEQKPQDGQGAALQYHPAEADATDPAADSEQAFESLYPVLRYRWTGGDVQATRSE